MLIVLARQTTRMFDIECDGKDLYASSVEVIFRIIEGEGSPWEVAEHSTNDD